MCETEATPATTAPLTPNKRVNYNLGMVLGVDDFRQEQVHLEWQDHLANRLLHGYGTVCGLHVAARPSEGDVEILIRRGYALSPHGRWIWVEQDQCARLNQWIQTHRDAHGAFFTPGSYTVYARLCYVECPTDQVPIAGQACAPEEENMAPSRTLESFHAELAWTAPEQGKEDTFRALGDLLGRVIVVGAETSPVEPDESDLLLELVRHLPELSPPADDGPIYLHEAAACATIQQALAIWVTEVCPRYAPPENEDCILLACIAFDVDEGGALIPGSVQVDNCQRPLLIPTRLQQELFCLIGGGQDHGALEGLNDDDHPHYLLADGSRPLGGPWSAGDNPITDLAPGSSGGDAIRYDQAVKIGDPAGGDLADTYPDPRVTGLQGRRVAPAPPSPDAVLTWDDDQERWEPRVHRHSMDDLTDVSAPAGSATDGQVLTHRGGVWLPEDAPSGAEMLDDLRDVDAAEPDRNDVLTFNGRRWVPRPLPEGSSGSFVQAPGGEYAIVAAGFFDENGQSLFGRPPYNGLEALPVGEGMYLLTFPLYPELIERVEEITLIVKGTLVDPNLPRHLDNPFDPETRADMPATFQVIEMNQEGVLVWITQPVLRFDHLLAVVREEMQFPDDFNVLHFAPTPRPFMVEISAFGPLGLDSAPRVARVNLNTATETELRSLPRIGPALARRILELREAQGGFTAVTDLRDVSGIDNFLVSRLAHLVTL